MATFEALYGCRCRTPLNWIKTGEKAIFVPDLIDEAEAMVHHIQDNFKPRGHVKKVMLTKDVDHWSLKLQITSTYGFHC
jgi:hypothetical protein